MNKIMAGTGWIQIDLKYHISYYREYIQDMEQVMLKKQSELELKFKKYFDELGEDDDDGWLVDAYLEEKDQHSKFNPSLLYHSTFISIYSYLEGLMKRCAQMVNKYITPGRILKEYRSNILTKYKNYLSASCSFEDTKDNWARIQDMRAIRNCLVHSNGALTDQDVEHKSGLYETASKYPEIKIDDEAGTFSIIGKELLMLFCDDIETVITSILKQVKVKSATVVSLASLK